MMIYANVLIAAAALAACSSGGSAPTGSGELSPSGEQVTIPVGESATVPGTDIRIAFLGVTEDSRCPLNAYCVWAGNGRVALRLSTPGASREAELNTLTEPREAAFAGLRIALSRLDPYPVTELVHPDDYVATFEVEGN